MTEENPAPGSANEVSLGGEAPKAKTNLFIGPNGLRAGWRLLIYVLIVVAFSAVINIAVRKFVGPQRGTPGVRAQFLQEMVGFAVVFGAAAILSKIERRRLGDYGLPASEMFGRKFWLGFLLGLVEVSLLIGLIGAFGGYSFGPLALEGGAILKWGMFHLVLFTFVGLFEEFLFRAYMQYTLADGIVFWPAAFILSVLFGGVHLGNPGEGWVGAAGGVLVALFFCFALK